MGVYTFKPHPGIRGSIPGSVLVGLYSLGGPRETCCCSKKTKKLHREGGRGQLKKGVEVVSNLESIHLSFGLVLFSLFLDLRSCRSVFLGSVVFLKD